MKTCDVCRRTDTQVVATEDHIYSLFIGTTIDTAVVSVTPSPGGQNVTHECPVVVELCETCIKVVNKSIAEHIQEKFGFAIRK